MNKIRSIILLLVYSLTLLTIPVSAQNHAFVAAASESAEKESVTNATLEHRESSSIKIAGKSNTSNNTKKYSSLFKSADNKTVQLATVNKLTVPYYIFYCIYRL